MAESPVKAPLSFLDLPGEVRNMVYDLVTQDSNIKLDFETIRRVWLKNPVSPFQMSTTKTKNAILGTCKTIRQEAMPLLAKNTNLEIRETCSRDDPLRCLAPKFLDQVTTITVDWKAFVHVNRQLLPSLKHVTIVVRSEGIESVWDGLHVLHCPSCGGPNHFLKASLNGIHDWKWMKDQIIYLSQQEGWALLFKLCWECYEPDDSILVSLLLSINRVV